MAFVKLIREFFKSERGSIESSLVLIPLLTVFLISSQLALAIHGRNMEQLQVQSQASAGAISGEFSATDTYLKIYSPDPEQDLDLVVSTRSRGLASLFPGLAEIVGRKPRIEVNGLAIVENQR
jgi:hypothetical protein